jgi:hypothetical protein
LKRRLQSVTKKPVGKRSSCGCQTRAQLAAVPAMADQAAPCAQPKKAGAQQRKSRHKAGFFVLQDARV